MVGVLKIVELVGDVLEVTAATNNRSYVRRELLWYWMARKSGGYF